MTDGGENNSKEYKLDEVKNRLKTAEERGWEVVFLGAEFNADATASSLGFGTIKTLNMAKGTRAHGMSTFAQATSTYATMDSAPIEFTDKDKKAVA